MGGSNPEPRLQTAAVDTHAHLFLLDDDPAAAVERARAAGVGTIVCVGIDVPTSRRSLELASIMPGVAATAGLHPHDASTYDAEVERELEALLEDPRVVAVGECGLDFYRMRSPVAEQERALRRQIAIARASDLPLVVHVRDAWPETLRLLSEGSVERVVFHCFSGDATLAAECVARGYFLSFAGNVTYPRNHDLRAAAAAVPLERILVETDSPFLAPQKIRGRDNEPARVLDAAEAVAEARGEPLGTVLEATSANARRAFHRLPEARISSLQ